MASVEKDVSNVQQGATSGEGVEKLLAETAQSVEIFIRKLKVLQSK